MPVLHPNASDTVLLRTGFAIDAQTITKLREHSVSSVWVRYPGLEFVGRFISPELESSRGVMAQVVAGVVERMAIDAQAPAEWGSYKRAVRGLIESMGEHPDAGLLVQNMHEACHPLVRHSADVCYLSLLMGMRLEHYLVQQRERLPQHRARSIVELGLAALVHDVGLLAMPPEAFERWARNGADETDDAWREHVLIGYERVREEVPPAAAAAVLHHHQRYDGTGFPARKTASGGVRPPRGEEIHIFARILFAANLYDRLRFPVDGSAPNPSVRVLRVMQQRPIVDWLDPVVFRALLSVAPAYAPGTLVRLSTGEDGAVIDWSVSDPCRPVVQVLDDAVRLGVDEAVRYDLRLRRDITITHADGVHVELDNFAPRREGEFDLYITNSAAVTPLDPEGDIAA